MPNGKHTKKKRIAAGSIVILMLLIMLLSVFFIAVEAVHDCSGEDCPICICIEQCENILHQVSDGMVSVISMLLPVVCIPFLLFLFVFNLPRETLVSKKVRMDD